MANNRTLTAANSIILLSVPGLFDTPQRLQGFSADAVTETDSITPIEVTMGVDGRLSAGFTPVGVPQNITLQADSQSADFFDTWQGAQEQAREVYAASGSVVLPATGKKYSMSRGFLTGFVKLPSVARTLQPRRFTIMWERVLLSPA